MRFFHNRQVADALLTTVEVEDNSALGLYNAVKKVFEDHEVPLSNIIGFGSDNCSTMMGAQSGFQARLKEDVPGVFVMGCVCHSFALCANHASKLLPSWLEALVKDICCYFSRSSKRKHQFSLIQDVVKAPQYNILKLCQTRWLSRGQVIACILEQWDALVLFFQSEARSDRVDGAAQIQERMSTVGTKHMLLFLGYILPKIDRMNIEFQSQDLRLHTLFNTISDEYRNILSMFIRDVIINQHISKIDPADTDLHWPFESMHVGGKCQAMLLRQPLAVNEGRFKRDCRAFLIELCNQMRKRFPFESDSVLAMISCLDPKEACSTNRSLTNITKLAMNFPMLVPEDDFDTLEEQWRAILYASDSLERLDSDSSTIFWDELRDLKDGNNQRRFGLLGNFMCHLLALPHSSACVERVFSQVNMIKTGRTNRLHASTLCNRLLANQAITRQGAECHNWKPSDRLLKDISNGACYQRYKKKQERQIDVIPYDVV